MDIVEFASISFSAISEVIRKLREARRFDSELGIEISRNELINVFVSAAAACARILDEKSRLLDANPNPNAETWREISLDAIVKMFENAGFEICEVDKARFELTESDL